MEKITMSKWNLVFDATLKNFHIHDVPIDNSTWPSLNPSQFSSQRSLGLEEGKTVKYVPFEKYKNDH